MKTITLVLALSSHGGAEPKICEAYTDAAGAKWVCCTQSNGQQCCSGSADGNGKPTGCSC